MPTQPKALLLADELEDMTCLWSPSVNRARVDKAAAELRRLHELLEAEQTLHQRVIYPELQRLRAQRGFIPAMKAYTAPPQRVAQQAEPVQDQRCRAEPRSDGDFVCDCKIGECPGRSAKPAQEPVAWHYRNNGGASVMHWGPSAKLDADMQVAKEYPNAHKVTPLYTAPPQRTMVPLTEEEIKTAFHAARNAKLGASQDNSRHRLSVIEIARAVEKASWEKNHGQA